MGLILTLHLNHLLNLPKNNMIIEYYYKEDFFKLFQQKSLKTNVKVINSYMWMDELKCQWIFEKKIPSSEVSAIIKIVYHQNYIFNYFFFGHRLLLLSLLLSHDIVCISSLFCDVFFLLYQIIIIQLLSIHNQLIFIL